MSRERAVRARARRHGADDAEVLVRDGSELTAKVRLGEPELVQEAASRALGLRVFRDGRARAHVHVAICGAALEALRRRDGRARASSPSPTSSTSCRRSRASSPRRMPDLDLYDDRGRRGRRRVGARRSASAARRRRARSTPTRHQLRGRDLVARARRDARSRPPAASSAAIAAATRRSSSSRCATTDRSGTRRSATATGGPPSLPRTSSRSPRRSASRRRAARSPRSARERSTTQECAIVFDPEVARAIVGTLFSVANGGAVLAQVELPRRQGGHAGRVAARHDRRRSADPARPGLAPVRRRRPGRRARTSWSTRGVLADRPVRRLLRRASSAAQSTGCAGRGIGGNPGPTTSNLDHAAGHDASARTLARRDRERGLYVTDDDGLRLQPGHRRLLARRAGLLDRERRAQPSRQRGHDRARTSTSSCKRIDAVGDDLDLRSSTACPTFRVAT